MSFGTIKIRKSDKLWREYLLKLRGERCEVCGKSGRVEISHFFGRRAESVRHSEKNCDLLCNYHHRYFHENPSEYSEWKKKKLGEKEFKKLVISKNTYSKKDEIGVCIAIKKLLENLNATS